MFCVKIVQIFGGGKVLNLIFEESRVDGFLKDTLLSSLVEILNKVVFNLDREDQRIFGDFGIFMSISFYSFLSLFFLIFFVSCFVYTDLYFGNIGSHFFHVNITYIFEVFWMPQHFNLQDGLKPDESWLEGKLWSFLSGQFVNVLNHHCFLLSHIFLKLKDCLVLFLVYFYFLFFIFFERKQWNIYVWQAV